MKNGSVVAEFERAFAEYVGAKFAIALCNGTATLHTALVALGVKPGDKVAVPPLTMASTTIAVLHAGAVPVFRDVDKDTWLIRNEPEDMVVVPVELYGLQIRNGSQDYRDTKYRRFVYDAAQALYKGQPYQGELVDAFRSYSFQASKILALGEGGMLATDSEELAVRARSFSSLGYQMNARQPRIDPNTLKSPTFARHHTLGWNYRMNDLTAAEGLRHFVPSLDFDDATGRLSRVRKPNELIAARREAASYYRDAIQNCEWLRPQAVPEGWTHDYWTYAVCADTPERCLKFLDAAEKHGGERPYPACRLTYHEPAFTHLPSLRHGIVARGLCPNAEYLQPRLIQAQTNNLESAERNAKAWKKAIEELS